MIRWLEEVGPEHFTLHTPTFSDLSIVAVLFFMDDRFSNDAYEIGLGFDQDQDSANLRKHQVKAIHRLCTDAISAGYELRRAESSREMALAFLFFCRAYCYGELGQVASKWFPVATESDDQLYQHELLCFFGKHALQWSWIYHELTPDLLETNRQSLEIYPESRLWALEQLPSVNSKQALLNNLFSNKG